MKLVMIVDDEPQVREVIGDILRDEGYGAVFASGGQDMLAKLETQRPHLILLDIMMPGGNGLDAMRALQARPDLRDIPIVLMSTGIAPRQLRGVPVTLMEKPFDIQKLLDVVHNAIGPAAG